MSDKLKEKKLHDHDHGLREHTHGAVDPSIFTKDKAIRAFSLGKRKATKQFTYGYGRVEDLAGLIVIVSIFLGAIVAMNPAS